MSEQHAPTPDPQETAPDTPRPPGLPGATDAPRLVLHGNDRIDPGFLDKAQVSYQVMADGARIRTAFWSPATDQPLGTVMVLTGFSEFIEKYYETAHDLQTMGFAVLCFDWRGQGLSTRAQVDRRGWVTNYEAMMHDVLELVSFVKDQASPSPLIALGHSMGGNVCLRLLQTHASLFDAAAVTAPMLGIKGIPTWLLRSITHTGSRVGMDEKYAPGAKDNDPHGPHVPLSTDQERITDWRSYLRHEPFLITHGATWRWVREAATSMHLVNQPANIAQITTPLLIANAMQDTLVDPIPTQKFADHCKAAELLVLEESQHEVLQEVDGIRNRFLSAFEAFSKRATARQRA